MFSTLGTYLVEQNAFFLKVYTFLYICSATAHISYFPNELSKVNCFTVVDCLNFALRPCAAHLWLCRDRFTLSLLSRYQPVMCSMLFPWLRGGFGAALITGIITFSPIESDIATAVRNQACKYANTL